MKLSREAYALYAITDRSWLGDSTLAEQVEKALKGGATFLQLREKDLDYDSFLKEAYVLKELCARYNVPFIINDNVDIAVEVDADGVHVGQEDMEAGRVRERLGPDKIIGVSCHTVEEALKAQASGADYLGSGAMFPTDTKLHAGCISTDTLRKICDAVDIPVVAIGGISLDNLEKLKGTGIAGVSVISAIFAQDDPEKAARELGEKLRDVL